MNRVRFMRLCVDCGEVPVENCGIFKCSCEGRLWPKVRPERGTESEEKYLAEHGFKFAPNGYGEDYYVGLDHVIHLLPNNRWDGDKAPEDCYYLEEYFAWIESKQQAR